MKAQAGTETPGTSVQLNSETYTETVTYTGDGRPNEPLRDFERVWSGQGWDDVQEHGYAFRPHRLRVRWMQLDDQVQWQSIEVTGRAVMDGRVTRHENRFIWTQHHEMIGGIIPADVIRFVQAHTPEAKTPGSARP